MEKRKIIGSISIIIGIVFLLSSQMTGAVISTSIDSSFGFLAGMALLIGGIGLMLAKESGLEIVVYDKKENRGNIDEKYFINDGGFRNPSKPDVSLREFKQIISEMVKEGGKEDSDELYEIIKSEYVPPLARMSSGDDVEIAKIANEFLRVLGEKAVSRQVPTQYIMPKSERNDIKNIFDSWNGSPTPRQRAVLKKYDMEFIIGTGKYNKIKHAGGTFPVSSTPKNEGTAAKGIARDIINHYEEDKNAA